MVERIHTYDVVVDFWQWFQRRHDPVANLALDKCEDALAKCDWDGFGFWHRIYLRERSKRPTVPLH
jgi:hypothetical protein